MKDLESWNFAQFYSGKKMKSMSAYMKYKYTDWIEELPIIQNSGLYELNPLSDSENNIESNVF